MKYALIERIRSAIYEFVKPPKNIRPVHRQTHTYFHITGTPQVVSDVVQVTIFPTGCKGLLTEKGAFYIVPPFWTHCRVEYADPARTAEKLANTFYGIPIENGACQ